MLSLPPPLEEEEEEEEEELSVPLPPVEEEEEDCPPPPVHALPVAHPTAHAKGNSVAPAEVAVVRMQLLAHSPMVYVFVIAGVPVHGSTPLKFCSAVIVLLPPTVMFQRMRVDASHP